jgi:hypothetical protein
MVCVNVTYISELQTLETAIKSGNRRGSCRNNSLYEKISKSICRNYDDKIKSSWKQHSPSNVSVYFVLSSVNHNTLPGTVILKPTTLHHREVVPADDISAVPANVR